MKMEYIVSIACTKSHKIAGGAGSGDPGSILGRYSPKVLVIPRNRLLRLNMTEKLFTGTLNHNQNKQTNT